MPKLSVGGIEVKNVMKAEVKVIHDTARDPARVPIMEWNVVVANHSEDVLGKWALAPSTPDKGGERFKRCELAILHRDGTTAHTWTLIKAYVHDYQETEFPAEGAPGDTTDAGNYIKMCIRGTQVQDSEDYTGENVMMVAPGEAEKPS